MQILRVLILGSPVTKAGQSSKQILLSPGLSLSLSAAQVPTLPSIHGSFLLITWVCHSKADVNANEGTVFKSLSFDQLINLRMCLITFILLIW